MKSMPLVYFLHALSVSGATSIIDTSYPTYMVCDVILALFTKIASTWSGRTLAESQLYKLEATI